MKIGMIGLGKAAKAVINVLIKNPKLEILWIIKLNKDQSIYQPESGSNQIPLYSINEISIEKFLDQSPVDVIIDFSICETITFYGKQAAKRHISLITAVSNYPIEKSALLKELANETCVFHSPNITVGVNFLIYAAKKLKKIAPNADINVIEEHFSSKNEISGTAKVIAETLGLEKDKLKSIRAGGIVGTHEILFGFPYQTVRLKHESISREAFGNGILFILDNLNFKINGLYSMEDLIAPYFLEDKQI